MFATHWIGSPPLVRERLIAQFVRVVFVGITPARAGKTEAKQLEEQRIQDHPRSCGKDVHITFIESKVKGSPPLVRERLFYFLDGGIVTGITPARAGKTWHYRQGI